MKLPLTILAAVLAVQVHAQAVSEQIRGDFEEVAHLGRLQGTSSLPVYTSNNVKGSRYLTPDWGTGKIISVQNVSYDNAKIMFDKQEQDVYIKATTDQVVLIGKNQIKSFTINNRTFVSGSQLPGADKDKYYELLAGNDQSIALYKQISTKFIKANHNDATRIKNGDFDDEFKDEITYYIKTPQQPLKAIKLTERNISRALPDKASKISDYFNSHYNDEKDDTFIIGLINSLNS
jgi:hypothetical protein